MRVARVARLVCRRVAVSRRGFASVPEGLKYVETHEWVRSEGPEATIGITDYAQDQLGDLVYVELPALGDVLAKGDSFGCVESVKSSSSVYAPVGGKVVAVNEALNEDPALINKDAYGEGWMIKIQLSDSSQLDDMLDSSAYKKLLN